MDYGLSAFKPCERTHQVKGCEEVSGGLFVSGGDTPEVSDGIEETLNQIALTIECKVAIAFDDAV